MSDIKAGDRVKPSESSVRRLRDDMHSQGTYEKKAQYKRWIDEKLAKRGTVTEVASNRYTPRFFRIAWDDGSTSETAPFLVTKCE